MLEYESVLPESGNTMPELADGRFAAWRSTGDSLGTAIKGESALTGRTDSGGFQQVKEAGAVRCRVGGIPSCISDS